jgi:hypothetical protein
MTPDLEKEVTKLEKYLIRNGRSELVVELRRLDLEQLKKRIQDQAIYKQESITARQKDEGLSEAKAKAKEMAAPYNESIRMNDKISRFISLLMGESGG